MTISRYLTPYQVATMQATLRDHMRTRGLTCAHLSRLSPAPLSASAIAQALRHPTCTTMLAGRIAHALGLTLEELCGPAEPPPAPEPDPCPPCEECGLTHSSMTPACGVIDDTPPWRLTGEGVGADFVVRLYAADTPYEHVAIRGEAEVRCLIDQLISRLLDHAYDQGVDAGKQSTFSLAP